MGKMMHPLCPLPCNQWFTTGGTYTTTFQSTFDIFDTRCHSIFYGINQLISFNHLSHHQFICLLQKLRRDRPVQFPCDIHGPTPVMLHIVCRSQEGIGSGASCDPVRLEFPNKQQHLAPSLLVMDIPLAGGRVRRRGALALPVEQVSLIE